MLPYKKKFNEIRLFYIPYAKSQFADLEKGKVTVFVRLIQQSNVSYSEHYTTNDI